MHREIFVYIDLQGVPYLVGKLWTRTVQGRQSATFKYADEWLQSPVRFSLEPALALNPGPYHTTADKSLFGSIGDSAPDRWGRLLIRRADAKRRQIENQKPRTLFEIDFLLHVTDYARPGALRFAEKECGPFLAEQSQLSIPPLIELSNLLFASEKIMDGNETNEELKMLLEPGSSLGGARPKASVRDRDGQLLIAKFPSKTDEGNAVLGEALALKLAERAKIKVPQWRIEYVGEKQVLLLNRFDRDRNYRIPFISAMSMLGAKDNESRCYLELCDVLRRWGASPKADMHNLWRRIVFNIMISNTDDHLRNHGFLYKGTDGWLLSPAYDLNPVPVEIKQRILSTEIDIGDATASLKLALNVADYFQLKEVEAKLIISEVASSVKTWRDEAAGIGLSKSEIFRIESAFEHEDLYFALGI
ncbi:MAG: type II toxin-antitoxin system HipA family toxin [Desulfobacterales bacterium]